MTDQYRIRWANVQYGNGYTLSTRRMCLAERKAWLGWWGVRDGEWRWNEDDALVDIERDKFLREPLPPIKHFR